MTTIVLSQINSLEMKTLRLLLGPGVYTVWHGANGVSEALYVGSAKNLLHRISHPKHGQLRLALSEGTKIEFEYRQTEEEARRAESIKIRDLQPKYNRAGKGNSYFWLNQ